MNFDVPYVSRQLPALERTIDGRPAAYFDSPGGTQVPQRVVEAVTDYLVNHNSNTGGFFAATIETDHLLADARDALADFLGCDWDEVVFGANTTTLNFLLAHGLARDLSEGDEVVITEIDHEANRGPWLALRERGVVVREVPVDPATSAALRASASSPLTSPSPSLPFSPLHSPSPSHDVSLAAASPSRNTPMRRNFW